MTIPAEVFADNRAALTRITAAIRDRLGDPDAVQGQLDRLQAWCTATEQFCDANYWSAALDVHLAAKRAEAADRERQLADAAAADMRNAQAAHERDVTERAAQLGVTYPAQKF